MSATPGKMRVSIIESDHRLRDRLRDRLALASELYCEEHHQGIVSVTIQARENGWFDARWTTCCETLEQRAVAIVKERC